MSSCPHDRTVVILNTIKCQSCGQTWGQGDYNPNCPDCEFEAHRCGHCGQQLGHSMAHVCSWAWGT